MGHYDDCYDDQYRDEQLREKRRLEKFYKAFNEFWSNCYRTHEAAPPSFASGERDLINTKIKARLYELKNLEG